MKTVALFVRGDSEYKTYPQIDSYDIERDALTFNGSCPVIAHPPCRAWGVLSHMANPEPGERELALWAVSVVRTNGGVLEHPAGSRLFVEGDLPEPGWFPDSYGGFTIEIDQYDFGHVAHKPTRLYIVGCSIGDLPPIPHRAGRAKKSITGQVPGTKRCTQKEREYTPRPLIDWMLKVIETMEVTR